MAPTRVTLLGRRDEEVVEVNEGGVITLECLVQESKPVASVKWYKDNVEINLGEYHFNYYLSCLNKIIEGLNLIFAFF